MFESFANSIIVRHQSIAAIAKFSRRQRAETSIPSATITIAKRLIRECGGRTKPCTGADDSKSARLVLKRMLERHALHVDTVESAAEAFDYLLHNRPDVIFMDYMMPDQQRAEDAEQKLELQLEHTRQQL